MVRQASPGFLAASADGRLAFGVDGEGRQVLHAVDTATGRVLLTAHLSESILGVVLADGADRFAVGTEAGVYLGSLGTSRVDPVVAGAVGVVALSADGTRLGLLGGIEEPSPAFPFRRAWPRPRVLALYDLDAKAWLARVATPIITPGEVAFDGGRRSSGPGMAGACTTDAPRRSPATSASTPTAAGASAAATR